MGDDTFSVVSGSTEGSSPLLFSLLRWPWAHKQQPYLNNGNLSPVIPSQSIDNTQALKNEIFESRLPTNFQLREDSEDIPMDSQTDLFESQQSLNNIDSLVSQSSGTISIQNEAKVISACKPDGPHQILTNLMNISLDGEENYMKARNGAGQSFGAEEDSKSTSSQSTLPPVAAAPLVPDGDGKRILAEGSLRKLFGADNDSKSISSQGTLPPVDSTHLAPYKKDVLELHISSQKLKDVVICSELKKSPPDISHNNTHEPTPHYVKDNKIKVNFSESLNNIVSIPTTLSFHSSIEPDFLHKENISQGHSCLEKPNEVKQKCIRSNFVVPCDNVAGASSVTEKLDTDQRKEPINSESQMTPNDLKSQNDSRAMKTQTKSSQIHQTEVDTLRRLIKIYDTALKKIEQKKPTATHLEKLQRITHQLAKGQEEERLRLNVFTTKTQQTTGNDVARRTKYETKLKQLEERQALLTTAQYHHRELLQRISSTEDRDKAQHCAGKEFATVENSQSSMTNSGSISTVGHVTKQECYHVVQNQVKDSSVCIGVPSSVNDKFSANQNSLTLRSGRQSSEELPSADQRCNEKGQDMSKRAQLLDKVGEDRCMEHLAPIQASEVLKSALSNESNITISPIDGSGGKEGRQGQHIDMLHLSTDHCYSGGSVQIELNPPSDCPVNNYCIPTQPVVVPSLDPYDAEYVQTFSRYHCSSELDSNTSKKETFSQPDTLSGWPVIVQCSQLPVEEKIKSIVSYGGSQKSLMTACNDYIEDVALVLELPHTYGRAVQSVADYSTSTIQDSMETIQAPHSFPEDKYVSPVLHDDKKQQNSNLTFTKPKTNDTVQLSSITDSRNVPVSHISGSSHPPNSPNSTVSSSFFPVSSKELIRRIEIRSAGQPFWNMMQPAIRAECNRQSPANVNAAAASTQHPPLKHTSPLAADTDNTANHIAKKPCIKEPAPRIRVQPDLTTQPPVSAIVASQQNLAISQFSKTSNTQDTNTSRCVTFNDVSNLTTHSIKPLKKRGRPKKEHTGSVGICGSSKNRKTNTQNIRKYFPIVVECSPVKCSDTVKPLADSVGVSESGHASSLTLDHKTGTTLPATPGKSEESDSDSGFLKTVLLVADAEVTNSSGDFPDFFWQENFANITMSRAFWDSLDVW